jgi:hypothetical protein
MPNLSKNVSFYSLNAKINSNVDYRQNESRGEKFREKFSQNFPSPLNKIFVVESEKNKKKCELLVDELIRLKSSE